MTGAIGLALTLAALRTRQYRRLSRSYREADGRADARATPEESFDGAAPMGSSAAG